MYVEQRRCSLDSKTHVIDPLEIVLGPLSTGAKELRPPSV